MTLTYPCFTIKCVDHNMPTLCYDFLNLFVMLGDVEYVERQEKEKEKKQSPLWEIASLLGIRAGNGARVFEGWTATAY